MTVPVWKRVLDRYLDSLAVERGLSANTVAGYRNDLTRLGEALAKRGGDLLTVQAPALAAHLRDLRVQGLSPRSISRALSAIRGFYENLVVLGERKDDPRTRRSVFVALVHLGDILAASDAPLPHPNRQHA